jgi:26S proteasome regulatory subunit T4
VGTRVALDFSTLTIMRILPREIDPVVFSMIEERNLKLKFKKYKKYFTIKFFIK